MARVEIVRATVDHARQLVATMRPDDAAECWSTGSTPADVVAQSLRESQVAHTLLIDGKVAALGGYAEPYGAVLGPRVAQVWLLTSKLVEQRKVSFHKGVRLWLQALRLQPIDSVWALVIADYRRCLYWLETLGFEVGSTVRVGPRATQFVYVMKEL